MKRAKSLSKKALKTSPIDDMQIRLGILRKYTIGDLKQQQQQQAMAFIGSLKQLIDSHNILLDTARSQSQVNQLSIFDAASHLESQIDTKILALNEFFNSELDKVYAKKPRKKKAKTSKKPSRKIKATVKNKRKK